MIREIAPEQFNVVKEVLTDLSLTFTEKKQASLKAVTPISQPIVQIIFDFVDDVLQNKLDEYEFYFEQYSKNVEAYRNKELTKNSLDKE